MTDNVILDTFIFLLSFVYIWHLHLLFYFHLTTYNHSETNFHHRIHGVLLNRLLAPILKWVKSWLFSFYISLHDLYEIGQFTFNYSMCRVLHLIEFVKKLFFCENCIKKIINMMASLLKVCAWFQSLNDCFYYRIQTTGKFCSPVLFTFDLNIPQRQFRHFKQVKHFQTVAK